VKYWLNEFEELCAAVNVGTVDGEFAFALESERVVRTFRLFENLIMYTRDTLAIPEVFVELETTALKWEREKIEQEGKRELEISNLQDQLVAARKASGVREKY